MAKTVTFQVVDNGVLRRTTDPNLWREYRMAVLREITYGAMAVVQDAARRLWRHPSGGGLDQSWHTRLDPERGVGAFYNSKKYAYWLNYGVMPHKMRYLLLNNRGAYYATVVDPKTGVTHEELRAKVKLVLRGEGETVIRTITERSLTENPIGPPWWHPGLPALGFLEAGVKQYRDFHLRDDFRGLTIRIFGGG